MKINKLTQKGSTIFFEIEEDYAAITLAMDDVFGEVIQKVSIPGFRKGKAPRNVYEKHYGQGELLERATLAVVNKGYQQAIKEKNIEPVDYPTNLKVKSMAPDKPFVFELEVAVRPKIKLSKYKGIKVDQAKIKVTDEDVEKMLEAQREKMYEYEIDDKRKVQKEDIIVYDQQAFIDNQECQPLIKEKASILVGKNVVHSDFDQHIIGLKKGEEKEFDLTFDDKAPEKEVRGKQVHFKIKLQEVRVKKLPDLDDAFAAKISDKKTIVELRKDLKEKMIKDHTQKAENESLHKLLKEIIKDIKIDIPEAMIKQGLAKRKNELERMLKQYSLSFEQFVTSGGKTLAQWEEENKPQVIDDIKISLTLEEIAKVEKIEPSEKEIKEELEKALKSLPDQDKEAKGFEQRIDIFKGYIKDQLREKKTMDFLKENNKIVVK